MGRLGLALKILFNSQVAQQALDALSGRPAALPDTSATTVEKPAPAAPPKPDRSDAVTLLAALQREARFVDFIQESIDGYNDAQVGAAVREIHRGCRTVLDRMFAPTPVVESREGSTVEVPDAKSERYRLTGNVAQTASGSVAGQLVHHGWQTTKCDVPKWSGSRKGAAVIAPAEVQVP
ncbi:MAG: DUF2760 domain-containing protein [Planctomycetaceae bacterium]